MCPQFDSCSAPNCPLDPLLSIRVAYPDEPKCKARKKTRLRLGHNDLPKMGLTNKEHGYYNGNPLYRAKINRLLEELDKESLSLGISVDSKEAVMDEGI